MKKRRVNLLSERSSGDVKVGMKEKNQIPRAPIKEQRWNEKRKGAKK